MGEIPIDDAGCGHVDHAFGNGCKVAVKMLGGFDDDELLGINVDAETGKGVPPVDLTAHRGGDDVAPSLGRSQPDASSEWNAHAPGGLSMGGQHLSHLHSQVERIAGAGTAFAS